MAEDWFIAINQHLTASHYTFHQTVSEIKKIGKNIKQITELDLSVTAMSSKSRSAPPPSSGQMEQDGF